jgi:tetratricopeptide (TPR) repeat protein
VLLIGKTISHYKVLGLELPGRFVRTQPAGKIAGGAIPANVWTSRLIGLFFLISMIIPSISFAENALTSEQWREDLQFMSEELPKRHLNLYHTMTRDDFESAVELLNERIPELQDHEIIVELSRIAAMIGDGHSGIRLYDDQNIEFSSCPIRFYQFEDGLYVQKAARRYENVVGARVVQIGDVAAEDAMELAGQVISRDNDMFITLFAPYLLTSPEILHALGIVSDVDEASYVFEVGGEDVTVKMKAQGKLRLTGHAHYDSGMEGVDWIDARDASEKETPLWLKRDVRDSYWFEYLETERALYFRYNEIMNSENESAAAFADRMANFIADNEVDLLVVDLRWNDGGNNARTRPVLRAIIQSKKIDQRGKLYAIIGRRTFSAAQTFVNEMELYTNVLFVGEPTAQNVNHYGDTYKIQLPNSGITVKASFIRFQQMDPRNDRQWTVPHISTALSSDDYRNNRDPALQAVFSHAQLLEQFNTFSSAADFDLLIEAYQAFKNNPENADFDTEALLNGLGYRLMGDGRLSHAITVFKANVEAYPNSANAFDSLGEAYLENGERDLAITNYEMAMRLDPDGRIGANAARMLEQIQKRSP